MYGLNVGKDVEPLLKIIEIHFAFFSLERIVYIYYVCLQLSDADNLSIQQLAVIIGSRTVHINALL